MKNRLMSTEIMTVHELALFLKASDAKVYRMARMGEVPAFRIGKSWRFEREMIETWIRQKTDTREHEIIMESYEYKKM